jgi:hypothetical protein
MQLLLLAGRLNRMRLEDCLKIFPIDKKLRYLTAWADLPKHNFGNKSLLDTYRFKLIKTQPVSLKLWVNPRGES